MSSRPGSIHSTSGAIANYARKMSHAVSRPGMEIIFDNHHDGKIYTNADPLSGRVQITAPSTARFDVVDITLEGSTKTFVESVSPTTGGARTTARHIFLKLVMPISDADYPHPRVAEAGHTYTFPFNFVIPQQLLPSACVHDVVSPHVHDAHLQLPPSMGDRQGHAPDDYCPDMSKVRYVVRARVVQHGVQDAKDVVLAEEAKRFQVAPAMPAAPPMSIGPHDVDYCLTKAKTLKKGMFSGKLGKITVSAAQPSAFVLPPPSSSSAASSAPVTTLTTVDLRFDPHDPSCQPPRLGGLTSKLKVLTFYAVRPTTNLAARAYLITDYDPTRGVYTAPVPLSSRCVESVSWTKHDSESERNISRRPSAVSTSSTSSVSSSDAETSHGTYYTARIIVPLTLPSSKTWIPSFHSCITSRIYSLDLNLTIHTPGTGVPASNVSLKVPVQIATEPNESRGLSVAEQAQELADAEEYLRPRVIEIPREELVGTSVLVRTQSRPQPTALPPSYEDAGTAESSRGGRGGRAFVEPSKC